MKPKCARPIYITIDVVCLPLHVSEKHRLFRESIHQCLKLIEVKYFIVVTQKSLRCNVCYYSCVLHFSEFKYRCIECLNEMGWACGAYG